MSIPTPPASTIYLCAFLLAILQFLAFTNFDSTGFRPVGVANLEGNACRTATSSCSCLPFTHRLNVQKCTAPSLDNF